MNASVLPFAHSFAYMLNCNAICSVFQTKHSRIRIPFAWQYNCVSLHIFMIKYTRRHFVFTFSMCLNIYQPIYYYMGRERESSRCFAMFCLTSFYKFYKHEMCNYFTEGFYGTERVRCQALLEQYLPKLSHLNRISTVSFHT